MRVRGLRRALVVLSLVAGWLVGATPANAASAQLLVYATREGLVGQVTANGHVIVPHDHFVSLPSWNALSPKGTGTFSVRACAGGRCVYEPVWDVGPWNTHDDYWSTTREQWKDLPVGLPESQAAYQNGYNGGLDQYGRTVLNPAGIDLADGAAWDGLRLPADNRWIALTLLWTGTGTQGQVVTNDGPLNVRSGPGTGYANVGLAGGYARVPILCQTYGERITGTAGTTRVWDRIGPGNYISNGYVVMDAGIRPPRC
jgi:hypothetical protein